MSSPRRALAPFAPLALLAACSQTPAVAPGDMAPPADLRPAILTITSTAFSSGGALTKKQAHPTCMGMNVNPPLAWTGAPGNAKSFALLMEDEDAIDLSGIPFVHWSLWDIPGGTASIAEGASGTSAPGSEGANGFGTVGYAGPCPPSKHNYRFTLYAIDQASLGIAGGAQRADVIGQITPHTVGSGYIAATYTP